MHLSPKEIDKLILHNAGFIAQKRFARGIKLNYPETVALIAAQLLEFIREGVAVRELMIRGKEILGLADVMEGVADMVAEVQVEGTFPDGTKLVTIHRPVCSEKVDTAWALYGSGLSRAGERIVDNIYHDKIGQKEVAAGDLQLNKGRETKILMVINRGDRPIQVGSHYHMVETNGALDFDRLASVGFRLNIPAGTAIRFEAGEEKEVELVAIAGAQKIFGGRGIVNGYADPQRNTDWAVKVQKFSTEEQV